MKKCDIWEKTIYIKTHYFTCKILQYTSLIGLTTISHMLNVYEICFNTTNYLIFNMQDFRYCCGPHFGLFWSAGIPTIYRYATRYTATQTELYMNFAQGEGYYQKCICHDSYGRWLFMG